MDGLNKPKLGKILSIIIEYKEISIIAGIIILIVILTLLSYI